MYNYYYIILLPVVAETKLCWLQHWQTQITITKEDTLFELTLYVPKNMFVSDSLHLFTFNSYHITL